MKNQSIRFLFVLISLINTAFNSHSKVNTTMIPTVGEVTNLADGSMYNFANPA